MGKKIYHPLGIAPVFEETVPMFNATTQKRNAVDPRTGLFEAYVSLPKITANEGRGPVVDLSLFYAPTVNNHACLGDGWSFAFTHYNEDLKRLTLSTGEVLAFDVSDAELEVSSIKVTLLETDDTLVVKLANGQSEHLKKVEGTALWFAEELWTPESLCVSLSWKTEKVEGGAYIQLCGVSDGALRLAAVDYGAVAADGARTVIITLWPDDAAEKFTYTLKQEKYALRSISASDSRQVILNYLDHVHCGWLLNDLTTFEGVRETVDYEDNGVRFERDMTVSMLPYVCQHELTPLGGQAEKRITEYEYLLSDNRDAHQTVIFEGEAKTTISYDDNHEVSSEEWINGDCQVSTSYRMSTDPQSGTRTVNTLYTIDRESGDDTETDDDSENGSEMERGEYLQSVCTRWDARNLCFRSGNGQVMHRFCYEQAHDDLRTVNDALSDMTPAIPDTIKTYIADRDLFVKHIDQYLREPELIKDVHFSMEISGNAKYMNADENAKGEFLPALIKAVQCNQWNKPTTVLVRLNHSAEGVAWTKLVNYYGRVRGTLDYGRLVQATQSDSTYTYAYSLEGTALTTTTTQTCQNSSRVSSETHSILSGRLIRQKDVDGNESTYEYDQCGRLIAFTQCAQSEVYRQVTTFAYPKLGRVETTEPDGKRWASEEDGLGNTVAEYMYDTAANVWRQMLMVRYNARGQKCKTTRFDYLPDGTEMSQSCEVLYDDWGQECGQRFSDDQVVKNLFDPVSRTRQESSSVTGSALKTTTYNDDDSIARVEWRGQDGQVWQTQTFTYTHAFQIATQTTEGPHGQHAISYSYDAAGRPLVEEHVEKSSTETVKDVMKYRFTYEYPDNLLIREASKISLDGHVLGERTFDSWGRITSLTRGGVSEMFTYEGAASMPSSRTCASQTLNYSYIAELGHQIGSISMGGKGSNVEQVRKNFSYSHGATKGASVSEGEQFLAFNHDLNGRLIEQRAKLLKSEVVFKCASSSAGRLLSETDPTDANITYGYNDKGQRTHVTINGKVVTRHRYDKGLLIEDVVTQNEDDIHVNYTYDPNGSEVYRRFTLAEAFDVSVRRDYCADGKLASIRLYDETRNMELGSHAYGYSPGGRLASCSSTGIWRPRTPSGKSIDQQEFVHGPLGNVIQRMTCFGEQKCTSTYTYEADKGFRLQKVMHDHPDYKKEATLEYDEAGRVIRDITGKTYAYDWLGRLTQAGSRYYTYDPCDRLLSSSSAAEKIPHQVIYDGFKVRGEFPVGDGTDMRHVLPGSSACQVQYKRAGNQTRTVMTLCDEDGTVLMTFDLISRVLRHHAYNAYGELGSAEGEALRGFNGEYRHAENEHYPLGRGYRWYAPQSMQFQAPDDLSPFDEGGPHPYGYCDGDPVNFSDPNGHLKIRRSHWDISASEPPPLGMGRDGALRIAVLWGAIGVLTAVMTGGTSLILTAMLVTMAAAAMATSIASVVVQDTDPEASKILGWVSLGLAVFGGATQLTRRVADLSARLARSGLAVARRLVNKTAMAAQHLRHRVTRAVLASRGTYVHPARARFYDARYVSKTVDPTPNYRAQAQPTKTVREALKAFDLGDVNIVICSVTGGLNNLSALGDEDAAWASSQINNATNLAWGHHRFGQYSGLGVFFSGRGLRFR